MNFSTVFADEKRKFHGSASNARKKWIEITFWRNIRKMNFTPEEDVL